MVQPVIPEKRPRTFLPADFGVTDWHALKPYCDDLLERSLQSKADLERWLADRSELDQVVSEDHYRRYIDKTCDTENEEFDARYNFFVEEIQPHLMQVSNALDKKLMASPLVRELPADRYYTFLRSVRNDLELFREENIPLFTKLDKESKKYYAITGKMTVEHQGRELTLQQASKLLEDPDRGVREAIYRKTSERRLQDVQALDDMFDTLIGIRQEIARNAGFDNFRDYKLRALGRFDYGVAECEEFHRSVELEIVPLVNELMRRRQTALNVDVLRPYDTEVETTGTRMETPFENANDLVEKSVECLSGLDPYFAGCLATMRNMGHLDLESRKGKAPGGYNMGLPETGVPFIFMNAAGTSGDVRTMLHEAGHAVHSFLMNRLDYSFDKNINSEMAELASMSMELFALREYDSFYPDEEQRRQAINSSLEKTIILIPWIALIDKFQHWIYTHPGHTAAERRNTWLEYHRRFSSDVIDWTGLEDVRANLWQKQLHLYMVPFYYIEYGIAQFGAFGMWRNFLSDANATLKNYKRALGLGGTVTLPAMYETAGVPFDFGREHISELRTFLESRLA